MTNASCMFSVQRRKLKTAIPGIKILSEDLDFRLMRIHHLCERIDYTFFVKLHNKFLNNKSVFIYGI